MVFEHDWGIAGVNIPVPPTRDGFGPFRLPPAYKKLREPGVFQRYRERFLTSDIAWFSAGASSDGRHVPHPPGFFPEFMALRESLPSGAVGNEARKALNEKLQHAVFDLATLWDRSLGGTTMVLHIEGTTVPNTPAEPQYLRAATYLPPAFIAAHPASHAGVARIAQIFLESVGVPTVQQWRNNAMLLGWPLTQTGLGASPNGASPELIPPPQQPGFAHYKFLGRPVGQLDALLSVIPPTPPGPVHVNPTVPLVFIDDEDDENEVFDDATMRLIDAIERASYAEAESAQRLEQIRQLEQQIDILIARLAATESLSNDLEGQLLTARRALSAHTTATAPTTPIRSRTTPAAQTPRWPPPYSPSPHAHAHSPAASLNPHSPLLAVPENPRSPRPRINLATRISWTLWISSSTRRTSSPSRLASGW
ncbi:hypothetical protein B0H13DRAFT_1926042 [Mycena leptocephala]|nr:hypothetical protein B0H13DRAFT_1926042 [Mycena leptocephala]